MYKFKYGKRGFALVTTLLILAIIGLLTLIGFRTYTQKQHADTFNAIVESNCGTIQTLIFAELASLDYETVKDYIFDTGEENIFRDAGIKNPATGLVQKKYELPGERGCVVVTYDDDIETFYINGNSYDNAPVFEKSLIAVIKTIQPSSSVELTEKIRKEIFWELVKCEDWGDREATKYYFPGCEGCPNFITVDISKYAEKSTELIDSCKENIMKKYNITKEIVIKITVEGVEKDWPLPEILTPPDCCN